MKPCEERAPVFARFGAKSNTENPSELSDGSAAEEPMVCMTLRWREVDSNLQSPVSGRTGFFETASTRNSEGFLFTISAWIDLHVRTDLAEEPLQHRQLLVGGVARLIVLGHRPDEPLLPRRQNASHRCAQYDRRLDVSRVIQIVDVAIA